LADYAIVQTGGKQYKVQTGETFRIESVPGDEGDEVTLDEVLALSQDGALTIGEPTISGARVTTEVVGKGRSKKLIVFKYKSKTRYRRKNGHRQSYTELRVTGISLGEGRGRRAASGA
jgi:large subunit ribosomal protein L21